MTTSSAHYVDPEREYGLYLDGKLEDLLNYLDSVPVASNDLHCRVIKELVNISMSGQIPEHLKLEWNRKRAEYARNLARTRNTGLGVIVLDRGSESSPSRHGSMTGT